VKQRSDPDWPTAADWLGTHDDPDMVVLGLPLSETSISQPCGAHETPAAVRRRLARLSTYHSERDVDLAPLEVHDAGDLRPQPSNKEIADAAREAGETPLAVFLGGDNAVTYPALMGLAGERLEAWGLITLDAHHDVRTYNGRPGSGSGVRALLDAGLPGDQVVQVGIGGFSNSAPYRRWCEEAGIEVVTAAEARYSSIEEVMSAAFERLGFSVDHIYVDLDVDVLDRAFAPACPGARPGGLASRELFAAAFLAGRDPRVRAVDIVEVDATADPDHCTVDVAAICLLNVAAGLVERLD
jgi:formimidoylglutamase